MRPYTVLVQRDTGDEEAGTYRTEEEAMVLVRRLESEGERVLVMTMGEASVSRDPSKTALMPVEFYRTPGKA